MAPNERIPNPLVERFLEENDLVPKEPILAAAFQAPPDQLREGCRRVQTIFAALPVFAASETQRKDLSRERFLALPSILVLLEMALGHHPEVAEAAQVSPALLKHALSLDRALHRLIYASEVLWRGGECGELILSAAARAVVTKLLKAAAARRDAQVPGAAGAETRFALETLLSEPDRLEAERKEERPRAAAGAPPGGGAPLASGAEAEDTAMVRILQAFLENRVRRA